MKVNQFNPEIKDWLQSGQQVSTPYGKQFVVRKGSGTALVMLHGFPTCGWDWYAVLPMLSEHFDCIVPDLLGFGFSEPPENGNYDTAQQVQTLCATLHQLDVQECHVIAFSYGSSVVQEWLHQLHQKPAGTGLIKIKSLCFLNGGLFPETNHPRLIQKLLLSPIGPLITHLAGKGALSKNLSALFSSEHPVSQSLLDQYWQYMRYKNANLRLHKQIGYLRERRSKAVQWQQALLLSQIPTQLQFGCQDNLSGPGVVEQYQALRKQMPVETDKGILTDIHLYDDAGHYPQLEIPMTVAANYLKFIQLLN